MPVVTARLRTSTIRGALHRGQPRVACRLEFEIPITGFGCSRDVELGSYLRIFCRGCDFCMANYQFFNALKSKDIF